MPFVRLSLGNITATDQMKTNQYPNEVRKDTFLDFNNLTIMM